MSSSNPKVPRGFVPRYNGWERFTHWSLALGFILATLSGLAMFYQAFWWMSALLGGGVTSRLIHPWAGLLMCVAFLPMALWYWRDNLLRDYDWAWMKKIVTVFTNRGEGVPEIDKYNAGQKLLFWSICASLLGLLVSGIVLWFDTDWGIAPVIVQLSGLLHALCGFVLFMGMIVHIYSATLWIRGSMRAMVRGYVKPHWAQHHHPLWYRRTVARITQGNNDPRAPLR